MITLKHRRSTERTLPHTDVYHGEEYLGYTIKMGKNGAVALGDNVAFVSKSGLWTFYETSYSATYRRIRIELKKIKVDIRA